MNHLPSRKRVVLIRPAYSRVYKLFGKLPKYREVRVPLGLLSLAGKLLENGYEVAVIDGEPRLLDNQEIIRRTMDFSPDFVGVTSTTPEIPLVRQLISGLKAANPKVITMLGGAHVTAVPEETLEEIPELDYAVVGDGEDAIMEIVRHLPRERIISTPLITDLDSLPMPAKHLVDPRDYTFPHPKKSMVTLDAIETSRGCPFNCIYCFHPNGNQTRFKSPERVREELRVASGQQHARMVMFFDDTFTLHKKRSLKIMQDMIDDRAGMQYYCFTRADTVDGDVIGMMRACGFAMITMGVETGSQDMLDRLGKGTRLEHYRRAYALAHKAGLETRGSFMIGNPYETWDTVQESIDFARSLDLFRVGVNITTPYPGTELYDMAKRGEGIELIDFDWRHFTRWGKAVIRTPGMSGPELEQAQLRFLAEFYSSPKVIGHHLKRLAEGNWSLYYYRPFLWSLKSAITKPWRRKAA